MVASCSPEPQRPGFAGIHGPFIKGLGHPHPCPFTPRARITAAGALGLLWRVHNLPLPLCLPSSASTPWGARPLGWALTYPDLSGL